MTSVLFHLLRGSKERRYKPVVTFTKQKLLKPGDKVNTFSFRKGRYQRGLIINTRPGGKNLIIKGVRAFRASDTSSEKEFSTNLTNFY